MSTNELPIDPANFDEQTPAAVDFYRHVNGGWLDANPVPPEYPSWGSFHQVHVRNEDILHGLLQSAADGPGAAGSTQQMVGDYFAAGMDEAAIAEAGIAPLKELLDRIDGVEVPEQAPAVVRELQLLGASPLHDLSISPDFEDSNSYLVYLGQGGLGLPEKDYYLRDDEKSETLRAAYLAHVTRQLINLGDDEDEAASAAAAILAFEKRLAGSSYSAEKLRDVQLTLNRFDVAGLDELMPAFGLRRHISEIGITSPSISIDNPGFFKDLDEVLAETPPATLRAYLRWHLVREYASALPAAFEEEDFDFYLRTLKGQQEQQPRWKRVLAMASADIGELVAQLYVEAAFSPEAKSRCEAMVDQLLGAMERSIRGLTWMTDATREAALAKLGTFSYKIGYPDRWRDYSGLHIDRSSLVENRMRAVAFEVDRQLARLGEPVDKDEWAMNAHIVNAYYNPLLNEIVFPAGILQPPFFHADADDAVNYGGIGTVIGHEITHGFDDQGGRFDGAGALREWWTEQDRSEFDRLAAVLAEQYDHYAVADDLNVNGRLTLGENIADLGGVAIALDALERVTDDPAATIGGFTPRQRFFLAYTTIWRMNYTDEALRLLVNTDPHSPGRFRVLGPLSNLPAFAEAFAIDDGAPMLRPRQDQVKIW